MSDAAADPTIDSPVDAFVYRSEPPVPRARPETGRVVATSGMAMNA